jgi:hypothetical protein
MTHLEDIRRVTWTLVATFTTTFEHRRIQIDAS